MPVSPPAAMKSCSCIDGPYQNSPCQYACRQQRCLYDYNNIWAAETYCSCLDRTLVLTCFIKTKNFSDEMRYNIFDLQIWNKECKGRLARERATTFFSSKLLTAFKKGGTIRAGRVLSVYTKKDDPTQLNCLHFLTTTCSIASSKFYSAGTEKFARIFSIYPAKILTLGESACFKLVIFLSSLTLHYWHVRWTRLCVVIFNKSWNFATQAACKTFKAKPKSFVLVCNVQQMRYFCMLQHFWHLFIFAFVRGFLSLKMDPGDTL